MNRLGLAIFALLIGGVGDGVGQQCSEAAFAVTAIAVSGLVVFDIATASASAHRYNRQHLAVVPRVDVRNGSYGFAASWSFGRSSRVHARSYAPPAPKSPGTAFVLSLTSTAAPMLLGAAIQDEAGGILFLGIDHRPERRSPLRGTSWPRARDNRAPGGRHRRGALLARRLHGLGIATADSGEYFIIGSRGATI